MIDPVTGIDYEEEARRYMSGRIRWLEGVVKELAQQIKELRAALEGE